MKILFVQQNPFLYTAIKIALEKEGLDLFILEDSSLFQNTVQTINPAVVILDITENNGIKCLLEAKQQNLQVVAICKNGKEELLQQALDNGADDFINFPIAISELVLRVSKLCRYKNLLAA